MSGEQSQRRANLSFRFALRTKSFRALAAIPQDSRQAFENLSKILPNLLAYPSCDVGGSGAATKFIAAARLIPCHRRYEILEVIVAVN
jgi:hypothetical protein